LSVVHLFLTSCYDINIRAQDFLFPFLFVLRLVHNVDLGDSLFRR
jgi:hypothetical protein